MSQKRACNGMYIYVTCIYIHVHICKIVELYVHTCITRVFLAITCRFPDFPADLTTVTFNLGNILHPRDFNLNKFECLRSLSTTLAAMDYSS